MKWLQGLDRSSVWFLLIALTLISFPWNSHWNSIGITLLILHWLFDKNLITKLRSLNTGLHFWLFILFFAINVIFLIGTDNLNAGVQSIEVKLSFLIIPILFSSENHLTQERWRALMNFFTLSCVVSVIVNLIHSFYTWPLNPYHRMNLPWTITHPGLLSNFYFVAAVYCLFGLVQNRTKWNRKHYLFLIAGLILIVFCLLLISKTVMLAFVLLFIYLVWKLSAFITQSIWRVFAVIVLVGVSLFLFMQLPMVKHRIEETYQNIEQSDENISLTNSTGSRLVSYKESWNLIKQHYMWGIGTGDANDALKQQLYKRGYKRLSEDNMHIHNQFLMTWIEQGIIGFLILIALLVFTNYELRFHYQLWPVWAGILLMLNAATDDILETQAGIVFFIFLIGLCIFSPKKRVGALFH